jgi:type III restriction enzyme
MKLQFDKDLEYQKQAVAAVVDLFKGQTPVQSNFTVMAWSGQVGMFDTEHGVGNRLELDEEDILNNLKVVQLRNCIANC